ncbi:MAG TPA: AraC family transcriptional regulator [Bacteroidia bacterium]|nr:AraC family transcriptional regulator [Bacteroidia bacterium]
MPLTVKSSSHNTIHSNGYTAQDFHSAELVEESRVMHTDFAEGKMMHWYFDGIRMAHSAWNYTRSETTEWSGALNVVTLYFNLKGKFSLHAGKNHKPLVLESHEHNMFATGDEPFRSLTGDEELKHENFLIQLTHESFAKLTQDAGDNITRFAEKISGEKPVILSGRNLHMNVALHAAIREITGCRFTGGLKKIFLLSKCLEVLVLQAEAYNNAQGQKIIYCKTDYDRERIRFAHDYLLGHMYAPPSLTELARVAGINEFKLKRGFRELFGNSVFGYLAEHRLGLARRDLQEGKKTATEIAFDLGYSSLQHFSAAFKKKYGISPKELVRQGRKK